MISVYDSKFKRLVLENGNGVVDFYCGPTLDDPAKFLLDFYQKKLTFQEAYSILLQMILDGERNKETK
jgi:hypothetical protein